METYVLALPKLGVGTTVRRTVLLLLLGWTHDEKEGYPSVYAGRHVGWRRAFRSKWPIMIAFNLLLFVLICWRYRV